MELCVGFGEAYPFPTKGVWGAAPALAIFRAFYLIFRLVLRLFVGVEI